MPSLDFASTTEAFTPATEAEGHVGRTPVLRRSIPWIPLAALLLCVGILGAISTTTDPLWWQLHFSRLGMLNDFSSQIFNTGLIVSGGIIAFSALPLRMKLQHAITVGMISDPRAVRFVPLIIVGLGGSLAMIGVIPLSLSEFAHDRAANGLIISFGILLVACRAFLRELTRLVVYMAAGAATTLILGIGAMLIESINLAAFETIGFATILTWLHLLERNLSLPGHHAVVKRPANAQQKSLSPIWWTSPRGSIVSQVAGATG